jgi:neurofibromin 1
MAQKVIDTNVEPEIALQAMQRLHSCYDKLLQILRTNKELIRQGLFSPESIEYLNSIETSLLISLCSSNMNISKVAVALFQQLHEMSTIASEICGEEVASLKPHFDLCERLSSVSFVVSSRLAIQKAFRKALSQIREPTQSITAAMGTAFDERDRLSKHLTSAAAGTRKMVGSRSMEAEMIVNEWINYSGFLASLGGSWYPDFANERGLPRRPESLSKSAIESLNRLKAFLKDECRYLASESTVLREKVTRTLSGDLSPRLFGLLFEQLDEITSGLFDTKGQPLCKDSNTIFVDQSVGLLKGLVDRITEPVNIPPYVDFGGILQSFCEYLERLGGRDPAKLQIKIKMCSLCELVAAKRDVLNLKQEVRLMNNLLGYIHKWSVETDALSKADVRVITEEDRALQRQSLRAMANISVNLPLLVTSEPDTDPLEAKSKLFKKYFDYFAIILKKCRVLDGLDDRRETINVNTELQTLLLKSKDAVKDLGPLRQSTVTIISNLVNANVEAGLRYCLPMAYTEDLRTKTSFLQLFTKMLEQRVDLEDLDETLPMDRIERIVEVFDL